jgi:hypothetical protein
MFILPYKDSSCWTSLLLLIILSCNKYYFPPEGESADWRKRKLYKKLKEGRKRLIIGNQRDLTYSSGMILKTEGFTNGRINNNASEKRCSHCNPVSFTSSVSPADCVQRTKQVWWRGEWEKWIHKGCAKVSATLKYHQYHILQYARH